MALLHWLQSPWVTLYISYINLPQKISDINELGYPTNDPYGLVAAFWNEEAPMTVFGNI